VKFLGVHKDQFWLVIECNRDPVHIDIVTKLDSDLETTRRPKPKKQTAILRIPLARYIQDTDAEVARHTTVAVERQKRKS